MCEVCDKRLIANGRCATCSLSPGVCHCLTGAFPTAKARSQAREWLDKQDKQS